MRAKTTGTGGATTRLKWTAFIAAQFCEWDKPDYRNALRVVRCQARQLVTRLPDYLKLLLNLPEITEMDQKYKSKLLDHLLANFVRRAASSP